MQYLKKNLFLLHFLNNFKTVTENDNLFTVHLLNVRLSSLNIYIYLLLISYTQYKTDRNRHTSKHSKWWNVIKYTRNSSGDEIANVNFLYDDIVHAVKIQ